MVNFNGVGSSNVFQAYKMQDMINKTGKKETEKKEDISKKEDVTTEVNSKVSLSEKAQQILDKIKEKYGDMDIFVADFDSDEEAQNIMNRGIKSYSLLITPDELEKMAEDEEYEQQRFNDIDNSFSTLKEVTEKYSVDAALEEDGDSTVVSSIGISVNSDGTTTLFANLKELNEKQKERIKAAREAKEEEEKKEEERLSKKSTKVSASSLEELLEKIKSVDWNEVDNETIPHNKIDFRG